MELRYESRPEVTRDPPEGQTQEQTQIQEQTQEQTQKQGGETEDSKIIHTFRWVEKTSRNSLEYNAYKNRLYGFVHSTITSHLSVIAASNKLKCSGRIPPKDGSTRQSSFLKDQNNDNKNAVFFRFVEKKNTKNDIISAILQARGGSVGGAGDLVFFLPFEEIVGDEASEDEESKNKGLSFSLAGGIDGKDGRNCFKDNISKTAKSRFDSGLRAAEDKIRYNEIGFYSEVPLDKIQIVLKKVSEQSNTEAIEKLIDRGFENTGQYEKNNAYWEVYVNKNMAPPPDFIVMTNTEIIVSEKKATNSGASNGATSSTSSPESDPAKPAGASSG